jgi:hypothetical protein
LWHRKQTVPPPIKRALASFLKDIDPAGLDLRYKARGSNHGNTQQYAQEIQAVRETLDAAAHGRTLLLTDSSTCAACNASTRNDSGCRGKASYIDPAFTGAKVAELRSLPLEFNSN